MQDEKILIHFDTNKTVIYALSTKLTLLKTCDVFFNETYVNDELFRKVDRIINNLKDNGYEINNKNTRLFATGVFESFSLEEKQQLIIRIYTTFGLYLNVLEKSLEDFYLKKKETNEGRLSL